MSDNHTQKQLQNVQFKDLGLIDYKEAWDYQEELFDQVVNIKLGNRDLSKSEKKEQQHYLLFCEHPHVYTLGKSGTDKNLLANDQALQAQQATFYKINRGGDITYHGPGQIVGYPILDLDCFFTDIHKYLRYLEEIIIRTLADYDITGERFEGSTGVWLDANNPAKARKICAMGVRCSRWVTMHGFAFNINVDLNYFGNIVPCGIDDKKVTSLNKELGKDINLEEVKITLKSHFETLFEARITS